MLAGMSWRMLGSSSAGESLLDAMGSQDEQSRMLAGMSLVKAGRKSVDLIEQAIRSGRASPGMIRLLADIGGSKARRLLEEAARGDADTLTQAARESLDLLQRIENLPTEN